MLQDYLRGLVATSLDITPSEVSIDEPVTSMGLDSMAAFELTNRIETETGVPVPIVRLLQGSTIVQLARFLAEQMSTRASGSAPMPRGDVPAGSIPLDVVAVRAGLDELSDDQVGALLDQLLASGESRP